MRKKRENEKQSSQGMEMFTFGDPVPVLEGNDILNYLECVWVDDYYYPPIDFIGLAKSLNSNVHHRSAISVKRNILGSCFIPSQLLSREDFKRFALDFLVFGNGYLEIVRNRLNQIIALKPVPAKYMRVTKKGFVYLYGTMQKVEYTKNQIFHLLEPDINQEIYGLPEYLAALASAFLNESATLFRRKYYQNGAHAGFILYLTDPAHKESDIDNLKEQFRNAKGAGNFKNLLLYSPNGQKDGIQLIPIADVSAKDEFFNIKNITRDDVLAAHRIPPALMGIIPQNTAGFGDSDKASSVFYRNELLPLQTTFQSLNDLLHQEIINFKEYKIEESNK